MVMEVGLAVPMLEYHIVMVVLVVLVYLAVTEVVHALRMVMLELLERMAVEVEVVLHL